MVLWIRGPILFGLLLLVGCTRGHYVYRADRDTYGILREKTHNKPWRPPLNFDVRPHPLSRFFDPTCYVDPLLPQPAPQLYAYQLPDLPERDPRRFRGDTVEAALEPAEEVPTPAADPESDSASEPHEPLVHPVHYESPAEPGPAVPAEGETPSPPPATDTADEISPGAELSTEGPEADGADSGVRLRVPPLSANAWQAVPEHCLRRMFEFESVRLEYERTFNDQPSDSTRVDAERVALEDVISLAMINSRDYQTQKELLYLTALRLTLERYDYMLKFSPTGNGVSALYTHTHVDDISDSSLRVNSALALEKTLATGGNLVARFANDVLLTFNGPQGFTADISSEALFSLSQSIFQRDIVFESLTQAERNVVYAARDFARFRRILFRNLATQYYNLLLTYRGIEIDSQDYFSTFRAFHQGEAEYRAGRLPRFQVDQLEQNALSSRNRLIGGCTSLEDALDQLKFAIGLPPELPLNVDLRELEELTLRDQAAVSGERVRRARRNLVQEAGLPNPDRGVLLNGAIDLTQRLIDLSNLRTNLGGEGLNKAALETLLAQLSVDEARLLVTYNRQALEQAEDETPPSPLRVFQRTLELIDSIARLAGRELQQIARGEHDAEQLEALERQLEALEQSYDSLREQLDQAVAERQIERVGALVETARSLLTDADNFLLELDRLANRAMPDEEQIMRRTMEQVEWLLEASEEALGAEGTTLPPITIDMDEAMLTALVSRFDLMNERGELADDWRQIKLAGDDLRSVLNLNATQRLTSTSRHDSAFDFTTDVSQTQVGIQFDAPLNRRAQRNTFRTALINYNAGLRALIQAEDTIKLDVRNDLRQLQLNQEQYRIAVASAALAYERVISTRLQLQLGVQNVAARDFLEAQQAYTASLSSVAGVQIRYILNRIDLFLDVEQLEVDAEGFWPQIYDQDVQPEPRYQLPPYALPAYGELPPRVWYSRKMRRMMFVPTGVSRLPESVDAETSESHTGAPQSSELQTSEPQTSASINDDEGMEEIEAE